MKKIIYSFFLMSFAVISHADSYYFEGNIGRYDLDTVNTNTYSGTSSGITFSSLRGDLDYDEDYALGFELGMRINDNVRLGISYTDLDYHLKVLRLVVLLLMDQQLLMQVQELLQLM